ncbi:trehalose-phosphatase [Paracoccaceae bacterium]|nr:trehalose-phosphatase [Paracoccaceae bacterium]
MVDQLFELVRYLDKLILIKKNEPLKVASLFTVKLLPKDIQKVALFLDVDGTLYEIENSPSLIKPCFKLQKKLYTIHNRLTGALALISGRSLDDLDRIFDNSKIPISGNHGAQLRDTLRLKEDQADTGNIKGIAHKIRELLNGQKNIEIENKGSNLSVHFRNSTIDRKEINKTIMELVKYEPKLTFLKGKEVLEVKPLSYNKGTAISYYMRTKPFIKRRPIFIGDDVSDEDGFETVNKKGGWSVRVGNYKRTKANYFLPNVKSVHEIMKQLLKSSKSIGEL